MTSERGAHTTRMASQTERSENTTIEAAGESTDGSVLS